HPLPTLFPYPTLFRSISISVDLPQPFGPTSAVTAPRGAVKLRSCTACTLPKARETCSATMPGACGVRRSFGPYGSFDRRTPHARSEEHTSELQSRFDL